MIAELIVLLLITLVTYFLYIYKRAHWKFDEAGIKYKPGVPIFGNTLKSWFLKHHFIEDIDEVYAEFPDEKYVGYLLMTRPLLLIKDPELIKNILVKDHDHFVNHMPSFSEEFDLLLGNSLLMMKDGRWRDMRTTLSPAFTSSKMRHMMPFINQISSNIVNHLKAHLEEDVDIDDLMRRYTNDVIASTAFGLQVDSLKEKDNEFYRTGQTMFIFTPLQKIYLFLISAMPKFFKLLKTQILSKSVTKFFHKIATTTMTHRLKNNIYRPDMIQLLIEASKDSPNYTSTKSDDSDQTAMVGDAFKRKAPSTKWTREEIAGQLLIFFIAGFDSTASSLIMFIHELTLNPDVQEKLYQEFISYTKQHEELTYDGLNKFKYLDCVLNEAFRKWSVAQIFDRECNKAYVLPPPREGGKPYVIQPGEYVYNLANSLHMDPKYFPNPEVFDPERFSEENKHNIKPFTFMPFGVGPRSCIGTNFALLKMKVLIFNLFLNFKILKCSKTSDPLRLQPDFFAIKAAGGTWVQLEERIQ